MRPVEPNETKKLYERLCGYDTIAAIVDELLARMGADPAFHRFAGRSLDSRHRTRQLLVDQLCGLAGGPGIYTGRDMKTSHAGLGIIAAECEASLRHAEAALDKFRIPGREKAEFLAFFQRYRGEIVEG